MTTDIRPIRTDVDYEEAMAEVKRLWGAKDGSPEGDRLEVLATLIEAYEEKHFPVGMPDPIDALKFCMEQQGLKPKDLGSYLGSSARVSEVLNRKRTLSLDMIRKLHAGLGIPMEVLVGRAKPQASRAPGVAKHKIQRAVPKRMSASKVTVRSKAGRTRHKSGAT
jgi:HTH-type transcriptional regulator / antitoxin HigA